MTLDELIADLQAQFPSQAEAGELPSRAAVHRYGQKLERRLAAIRASTEAAKLIRAQAGDDLDARSEALTAMIQSELFESIISCRRLVMKRWTRPIVSDCWRLRPRTSRR